MIRQIDPHAKSRVDGDDRSRAILGFLAGYGKNANNDAITQFVDDQGFKRKKNARHEVLDLLDAGFVISEKISGKRVFNITESGREYAASFMGMAWLNDTHARKPTAVEQINTLKVDISKLKRLHEQDLQKLQNQIADLISQRDDLISDKDDLLNEIDELRQSYFAN